MPPVRTIVIGVCLLLAGSVAAQQPAIDAAALVDDLRRLSADDMEGRRVGTAGSARARALLVTRFREAGLRPFSGSFEKPFGGGRGVAGVNVAGFVEGRVRRDRYIVVSAHYDHLGVQNGRTFNGANDNASGTAALIALATHFVRNPPATSLLFVAFDAEEPGLVGSRAFVERPPVERDALAVNLNMDMIGRDPANTLWVVGTRRHPTLRTLIERVATDAPVSLRMGYDGPGGGPREDWTRDSDHWSFMQAGIPALYFGVEDFALHHHPEDDFETMTLDFYVRAVRTMVRVIETFDAAVPELIRLRGAGQVAP
jgi:hypothetical protein